MDEESRLDGGAAERMESEGVKVRRRKRGLERKRGAGRRMLREKRKKG